MKHMFVREDPECDWSDIAGSIWKEQPALAHRLRKSLPRPASREDVVDVLGSLAEPFTLVRTGLNVN